MTDRFRRPSGEGIKTHWSGFRPFYDYWGNELKRFYLLETLANATDRMLRDCDRFVLPSTQEVLGPAQLQGMSFELFQEGRYQLIFRLRAANARGKKATFGLVVAKNAQECSAVARNEHRNLQLLHARAPEHVVRTFRGGVIFLPDRYQRPGHGREIYAYLTQWLPDYDELGVNKNLQCIANTERVHTFSLADTERIKMMMCETVFRTYEAKTHTCMAMPEIASGDFVVLWSRRGQLKIRMIACRKLLNRVDPARVLAEVMNASWDWGGRRFHLMPEDPEMLGAALVNAWGASMAAQAVARCSNETSPGRTRVRDREYLEALQALMLK